MTNDTSVANTAFILRNPEAVAAPVAGYSHLAIVPAVSDLLVVAGQIGNDRDGGIDPSVEVQYEQALRNVVAILESVGAMPADIIKLNYFLVEKLDRDRGREIREAVLGDVAPPTTFAYVSGLARPEFLVEIEALAARTSRPAT